MLPFHKKYSRKSYIYLPTVKYNTRLLLYAVKFDNFDFSSELSLKEVKTKWAVTLQVWK